MSKRSKKKKGKVVPIAIFILIIGLVSVAGYIANNKIFQPNVSLTNTDEVFLYIPTGSTFEEVVDIINNRKILKNTTSFELVARKMGYPDAIKPGKYRIYDHMNNRELVRLLRSGIQTPVNLVFNRCRNIRQLCAIVSTQIEADSISLFQLLSDKQYLDSIGYDSRSITSLFIPNTYEFFWNTSARGFLNRMIRENQNFWTAHRMDKCRQLNLSKLEVSTLASIVEMETAKNDEKPRIAGVYLNRIKKHWKLEADPTLIFAANDFTIKRVLNIHKEIESPYNTYKYEGLPPGPICIPTISSIDAVLNHENHDYMFFCAKDDFSGYHSFSSSYGEHLANARRFQKELNRRKIKS